MSEEFLSALKHVSKTVRPRTKTSVVLKMVEEVGELSTEVAISDGLSYKERGKDGVVGEAVDVILCAMDLIVMEQPNITQDELMEVMYRKANKWQRSCTDNHKIDKN
ncbi:nucleoside triphosphate pyrophosphohydrolase [Tenacibaculum phage PTm1]|uniref:Nucleoside triphosphate pyrophosphohydrolase n=1 Tax=Tenacibaculum phage PTm1 TaxID=2547425 RepID=A0A5S9BZ28_9CAUD|nr:nucleoside triphosphate pyrophosphohydrolase [Tenacibaculum phage PTm1]BBI90507.1 nucleoside triphosphate pyrophosphohydrolase [Tenacibaculum phage PTm1]